MVERNTKWTKSVSLSLILIALGIAALLTGARWLVILVPAAMLVWYGATPALGGRRN